LKLLVLLPLLPRRARLKGLLYRSRRSRRLLHSLNRLNSPRGAVDVSQGVLIGPHLAGVVREATGNLCSVMMFLAEPFRPCSMSMWEEVTRFSGHAPGNRHIRRRRSSSSHSSSSHTNCLNSGWICFVPFT
jgi:hypothetical protein